MSELRTYKIIGTHHRTGELIEGVTQWDGLSSVYPVTRSDGSGAWLSDLDDPDLIEIDG